MTRLSCITVLFLTALLVFGGCTRTTSEKAADVNDQAPQFTLNSYDDTTVDLSQFREKIVVLEWFNYECPFVKYHYEQKKTMIELADKFSKHEVVWLAVNSTSHAAVEETRRFAADHKITYPILDDRTGRVGRAYGAVATPHMFIIDHNGIIVYSGAIDNAPLGETAQPYVNYVDKALMELTAGGKVGIPKTKPYGCSVKYAQTN
ncbi:MAG: redoxin domain-containing protein [Planctomycetota bacterium]